MADTLAKLIVELQVQNAQLKAGLDEANKKIDDFGKKASDAGRSISQAISLDVLKEAAQALGEFALKGLELSDQMGKLAQRAGVPVEQFSRLAFAANMSEVSADDLAVSMGKLDRKMSEGFSGADKGAAAAFKALNVQLTDSSGKMRSSEEVMVQVADRFADLQDGAAKTTVAQELFGKSGATLIPLLDKGADGIWDLEQAADKYGATVDEHASKAAEEFNDKLRTFKEIGQGVAMRVAADLTPSFNKLADQLLNSATKGDTLNDVVKVLANTLRALVSAGAVVAGIFEVVGKTIGAVGAEIAQLLDKDFSGAKETMKLLGGDLADVASETADKLKAIWSDEDKGLSGGAKEQEKHIKKTGDRIVKQIDDYKKAMAEAEQTAKRLGDAMPKAAAEVQKAGAAADAAAEEKRRANAQASAPWFSGPDTRGFESFDRAVEEMVAAQVNEAHMRQQAALAEIKKDGDTQAAALKMAEQFKHTADQAGKAADAFTAIDAAARSAQKSMFEKAVGSRVTGLINAGAQGAAAGAAAGPEGAAVGAVIGVGLDLLTQSKQFGELMKLVDEVIQNVADALGSLLEPLLPFAKLIEMFSFALTSIVGPIFQALEPVFTVLYDVLRGFILLVLNVEEFIVSIVNGVAHLFGAKGIDDSGLKSGIDKLNAANYGAAESTDKLGKAADNASEEILNAAQGYKGLALARWGAVDMDSGPPGSGGGSGSGEGGSPAGGVGVGGGGPGGGAGGHARSMNLTGPSGRQPVVVVVEADLERYVSVQQRNSSYARTGSTRRVSLSHDY